MSSLHNQPEVEDIVSAFESAQNQSWSKFSDKLGGVPIKECKKKDIFKSENPIELADEDIRVFGLVPRLEKLTLVSCDKCSMIVKSDCIHYHYNHRHNNPENDLFSVAQFIIPNVKTNKHKRPKLNVRKLPEKKIIDGVNIDPIVQGIKSEFDQAEFERISELNRATEQQGNIIQYDGASTSVNLALHCTPGTSYFNELCSESLVQYPDPDHNEVNDQMMDYDEDLTKSVGIIKELQNNKCIDDTDDSISEDIVHCITKVELNEKRKRRIDCNDDEEFFENNHPKKKYHLFPFEQISGEHSSLKTSNNCTDIIKNLKSENVFTCYDQEVSDKVTDCDKNLNKLLGYRKELKVIDYEDDIDRNTINYTNRTTSPGSIMNTELKSFDLNQKRVIEVNLTDILNNYNSENKNNSLSIKPYVTNITGNKYSDIMKNQNVVTYNHSENFKKADCEKNLNELLDGETKPKSYRLLNNTVHHKMFYRDTSSEVSPIKPLDSSKNIKYTTDCSDFISDDKEYYKNNQDSVNKNQHLPLKPRTYITSNSYSSVPSSESVENVASCDAKVDDKITECNKDPNKLLNDGEKLWSNKCVNDNINENIVNYFTVSNEPLDKLSLNLNNKRKHKKKSEDFMDKNNKQFYEKKLYSKHKSGYLPFESSNYISTMEYEDDEYKIDETNINAKISYYTLPAKSYNDQKLISFTPISKFIKHMDSQCCSDSISSFHKSSIVKHEIVDQTDKFNDISKNINLLIPLRSLDNEKFVNCIPIDKYVKAMDNQCSGDSLTNFNKSSIFEDEVKDEIIFKPKIAYLPLPFTSSNNNIPKKYNPIIDGLKTENDQYSSNSVPDFHESSFVKHEDFKDEIDKINTNSNIIYMPLPPRSFIEENPKRYFPISKFVKAVDKRCTSNSITNIQKFSSIKHEHIEDKMDQVNENSENVCISLLLRSLNDSKPYIPISEFIKTLNGECSSNSGSSFHKSSSAEHETVTDKISGINDNSNIIYFPLPPKSLIDKKLKTHIPIGKFTKTMDDKCYNDSGHSFHKFPSIKQEYVEDKVDKINVNSQNLCMSLPSKPLNDYKPYIPVGKFIKTTNDECFSNSGNSFHKFSSTEHENVKDKISEFNGNSNIIYFPLSPKSLNDKKQTKYVPISKIVKATKDLHSNNFGTSFHMSLSVKHKRIQSKLDKTCVNFKLFCFPLPSKSLNDKKIKKIFFIRKVVKTTGDQYLNNSITTCDKLLIESQNAKDNIQISSNYVSSYNINDGDENDKSKVQCYRLPSVLMNSKSKITYLPPYNHSKVLDSKYSDKVVFSNNHSTILPSNIDEESKFAQNMYTVKNIQNPDICYDHSSTALQGFENDEYCNSFYNAYQVPNDYTLRQVMKPLSSVSQHFDSDINTLSVKELGSKTDEILKNNYCSLSKFQSNEKPIKPINAYSDIINNRYYDDAFVSYKKSSILSLVTKELKPLPIIDNSNVMINNTLKNDYQLPSQLLNNQSKVKLTPNKHSDVIYDENVDTFTSSHDQPSVSLLDSYKRTKLSLKDLLSGIKSDENSYNVNKFQDGLMINNKCTKNDGFFGHLNHQFINPIFRNDKSIDESQDINDYNTKYSQTDLLIGCINNKTNDLIDNSIPVKSNDEIVENVMNNYTSYISNNQISEYAANSCTSVRSNTKSVNNTISFTSITGYDLTDNNNSDDNLHRFQHSLWNPESQNDHFSNCSTHNISSGNNRWLDSYGKTCSSITDRTVQDEYYSNHKINQSISDVDKYFQLYKDRLKKTTDEKLINSKNWKTMSRNNIEAKMRKNTKRRLGSKVIDNKENCGVWDQTESLGYERSYVFVVRPALHQSHFSDESD